MDHAQFCEVDMLTREGSCPVLILMAKSSCYWSRVRSLTLLSVSKSAHAFWYLNISSSAVGREVGKEHFLTHLDKPRLPVSFEKSPTRTVPSLSISNY